MANVEPPTKDEQEKEFLKLHAILDTKEKRTAFEKAIDRAFSDLEQKGILEKLDQDPDQGSQTEIEVHPVTSTWASPVPVAEVRSGDAIAAASQSTQARVGFAGNRSARVLLDQAKARKADDAEEG